MSEPRTYPADHPVTIALVAMASAYLLRIPLFEALTERARRYGIATGCDRFDQAAEVAGMPYCRALDLYVDRQTKARAEALHFSEAHRALLT
jgi:hypothetical protein